MIKPALNQTVARPKIAGFLNSQIDNNKTFKILSISSVRSVRIDWDKMIETK